MHTKYKRNYLDNVVLRIDFPVIEDRKGFQFALRALSSKFPYQNKSQELEGIVQISPAGEVTNNRKMNDVWDYWDAYKNKNIRITHTFLAIQYLNRSYINSKELVQDCKDIIDIFTRDVGITSITRLGLRYINRFDLDAEVKNDIVWNKYFSSNLLGSIGFAKKIKRPIARAMSVLQLKYEDHDIQMQYGIWNKDFPSENTRKEFIVDIDSHSRFALESVSELTSMVQKYNKDIESIFLQSIGGEMKKLLTKR